MKIDKDTKLYGSLSLKAGSNGCKFFNEHFQKFGINAIYKSFSVNNFYESLCALKTLRFGGCAVSMPFKINACEYVDKLHSTVDKCGSLNTILFHEDYTIGYNTDFLAAYRMLAIYNSENKPVYLLGTGGLSKSYQAACIDRGIKFNILNRQNIDASFTLNNEIIFNCTPVKLDIKNNIYVDCLVDTPTGYEFFLYQAREQFKLYTGYELPIT